MARYTENFPVDKSFADAWRAVHAALTIHNWRIVNVRDNTFFIRERLSFETMLWRNPSRFAIHIRGEGEDVERATVFLVGATLGFGPLPKARLRRVAETLKGQILATIAQISDAERA